MRVLVGACALASIALLAAPGAARAATVWDGVYAAEQAEQGLKLYADRCADCHGVNMEGAQDSPPLADIGFLYVWDGMPLSELSKFIAETMPVGEVGTLNETEIAELTAAILQANGYPASNDGGTLSEAQAGIAILREQPPSAD